MKRALSASLLVFALAATGCGSDEVTSSDLDSANAAPKRSASLSVAATSARTGDATTASSDGGVERLARERRVDPGAVRKRKADRQGVGAGASCANVDVLPEGGNLAIVQAATLCLLNGERADRGLAPLTENAKLAQAALGHSQDMVANSYFSHDGRNGSDVVDRIKATGYLPTNGRWSVGENLAWGTGTLATPAGIVNAWMNSQGHRDNILRGDYKEIGFGLVTGNPKSSDGQGATYTTTFGVVSGGTTASAAGSTATRTVSAAARKRAAERRRRAKARRARAARARAARARAARARAAAARR